VTNSILRNSCGDMVLDARSAGVSNGGGVSYSMQRAAFDNILHYNITATNPGCASINYAMEITSAAQSWGGNVTCQNSVLPYTCTFQGIYSIDAQSSITATSVTGGNTLTVTTCNSFSVGDQQYLTGTAESFLNGQTVTISALLTGTGCGSANTGYTATFTHANYSNLADSGFSNPVVSNTAAIGYQVMNFRTGDPVYVSGCSASTGINMPTQCIGAGCPTGGTNVAATIGPASYGSTAWSGAWTHLNLEVTYPWSALQGNTGQTDSSDSCTITNIQGNPQFLSIDHNTLITDAVESVGVGPDLTKGPNFQLQHLFRNSIMLSSPGATKAGWYNPVVNVEGLPNPSTYGTENFNYDVNSMTADYLVWPGRTNTNYTEFPNNAIYPDAGCVSGSPGWVAGPPAYCYPPNTMYFPATPYCTTLTPTSACVGFAGALSLPTGPMPLALADYHGYRLSAISGSPSYFLNKASDGTDMGVIIPSLDTAQTTNLYVCTSSCGSPGPFPD